MVVDVAEMVEAEDADEMTNQEVKDAQAEDAVTLTVKDVATDAHLMIRGRRSDKRSNENSGNRKERRRSEGKSLSDRPRRSRRRD